VDVVFSSPWVPAEWIRAHGFDPRGVWSAPLRRAAPVSEGACIFAQQLADGAAGHPEAALVFATACDQMRRAADAAAHGHPRVFLFNLPATWQSPTVRRLFQSEVERLGRFLQRLGGEAPSEERLESVLLEWDRRRQRLRELLPQARARHAAEMLMSFFHDGSVPDTMPLGSAPALGIPLALVGGPLQQPELDLFDALESVGGRVVLNATEPGERCLLPPLRPLRRGQAPLAALVDHYFDHAVDVFHRPHTRLYDWLGERLAERRVRGIVLWVHVGCDLWRAEAASLREAFGRPVLMLDSHETRGIGPRDLTRLGAFVESLQ
jgi:benzoyl-CoA reductase/2-hydroxyglutaryl-CoA dehydratase subunit BcrC/BadD/HgdB